MTTLVTGATGHVGANLVRALLDRGERVRALVLPGERTAAIDGLDLERAEGDLRDGDSVVRAMQGIDRVYHCAAFVSLRKGDHETLFDVNVLGTRRVMRAALEAGVERVVHTSSLGAVGRNPHGASDESWPANPFDTHLAYEMTKALAEHEVLRAVLDGLDAVMVNPSGIVGPFDFAPSAVGQTILVLARGKLRAYVEGAFDFVPVRDVVAGHLLAMEKGRRGERYLLSGEVATISQTLGWLAELLGRPAPRLRIPLALLRPVAGVKDRIEARLFPERIPRFTAQTIELLRSGKRGDNGKARRELGLVPTPVRDAYRDQVAWFRSVGRI